MKKKLVALITNHDDDVYCFRKELIETIIEAGYEMLIICPYGEKFELLKNIEYKYEDIYMDRRGINPLKDLKLISDYYKILKKYKPSVVLAYTLKPNIYVSLLASVLKIPYLNNITGMGSILNMNKNIQNFMMFLFKIALKKSACIFFQNEYNMNIFLNKGIVNGEYKLIPGSGVSLQRFPLLDYPEGGNGTEGESVVFNYIGRILKEKGIDDYLAAAEIIKTKYPKTEFNILGFVEPTEEYYNNKLKELESKNIIKYWGQQKDVIPFIKKAHAIIHPSVYGEGISNVLIENASSGRVIITTDNPGCKDTVIENISGFIYPGNNVNALTEKIEAFLNMSNKERKQMGLKGREYAVNNFDRQIVINAYLNNINNLLKG